MKIDFIWYDFWIGAFYDTTKRILYICPLPMLVLIIPFNATKEDKE